MDDTTQLSGAPPQQEATPIHKAPVEILSTIFGHVVSPDERKAFKDEYPDTEDIRSSFSGINTFNYKSCSSPFAISHVSRHWRSVALAYSEIWATFDILHPGLHFVHLTALWVS